jgi:hypothetical protein
LSPGAHFKLLLTSTRCYHFQRGAATSSDKASSGRRLPVAAIGGLSGLGSTIHTMMIWSVALDRLRGSNPLTVASLDVQEGFDLAWNMWRASLKLDPTED